MLILDLLHQSVAMAQTIPAPIPSTVVAAPSGGLLSWLGDNWQNVIVLILAVDAALIPLFPKIGFLVTLKNLLSGVVTPKP